MTAAGRSERCFPVVVEKIACDEDHGSLAEHAVEFFDRRTDRGSPSFGAEGKQLSNDPHDVSRALSRGNVLFDAIRKSQQSDLVIVETRAEGERGDDLRDHVFLELTLSPEIERS